MDIAHRSLADFISLIRRKKPFAYSQWGDSEWQSVFGQQRGKDRNKHSYFPQMAVDLRMVLASRPGYLLGLPEEVQNLYGDNVKVWLGSQRLHDLAWVAGDAFKEASVLGELGPMVDALRAAPALVVVGPPHLAKLNKFLGYDEFVTVPPRNCYLAIKSLFRAVMGAAENLPTGSVVSISAGMPAKILVDMLSKKLKRHCVIDFGSVWDPYVGVMSRPYMKKMILPETACG